MFRPGRENGIPAEPENIDCDRVGECFSGHERRAYLRHTGRPRLPLAATCGAKGRRRLTKVHPDIVPIR
jgi:hypothetical protein